MRAQSDVDSNSVGVPFDRKAVLGGALRRRVLSMELTPGVVVGELALCDEFGLSRPPVRKLLRQIAAEGHIELEANRASHVATMSHGLLHTFFPTASLIYIATTRLATTHVSEAEAEMLGMIQEDFHRAIEGEHVENYVVHNDTFHLEIDGMTHNNYLIPSPCHLLIDYARLDKIFYHHPTTNDMQRDLKLTYSRHDQIIDAIQQYDPGAATDIVRAHLELSRRRMAEYAAPVGVEAALVYEGQRAPHVMAPPEKQRRSCRG